MGKNVEEIDGGNDNEEHPHGFPIQDTDGHMHMKKIPPSWLLISWSKVRGSEKLSLAI